MSSHTQPYKPKRSHSFIMRLTLLIIVLAFITVIGLNIFKGMMISKGIANAGEQPSRLQQLKLKPNNGRPVIETTGLVRQNQGSMLSSQISGTVSKILVRSGQEVKRRFAGRIR